MTDKTEKETSFLELVDHYKEVVAKVCYMYAGPQAGFDDLYQEVLINIWQGMDSFRGDSKISTWIYRTAINTCITWHRRTARHSRCSTSLEDLVAEPADTSDDTRTYLEEYRELHRLISRLGPLDKALITLWLEEKPYDEIAQITGISQGNVAVRIHRIKDKLSRMASLQ
ncbi:MAG: sigma-70 family RNA polymerase sigma factor [Muribaculaceae bacterium]|nr:sigma-70 family RNA polymerase sigma factor [Muribaculaceae bacterium]